MTILVATGLHKEAAILSGPGVTAIAGGGDGARLERELEAAAHSTQAILSCGLAGALDPSLKAGDLVIGSLSPWDGSARSVVSPARPERGGALSTQRWAHAEGMGRVSATGEIDPDDHPHPSAASRLPPSPNGRGNAALFDALTTHLIGSYVGTIVGSDTIIASVAEKHTLHTTTNALAVDMESHIAARVAARHGLPFAIVRAISDTADHALPPAALVGMRPDGSMALGAVLASLARNPRQLPALIRTGRDAGHAFSALRRVRDVLAGLGIRLADDLELPLNMR
ncbi:phosphorylase [Sphingomonas sp. QA11]|uniref:phosphorylase family protein n=1 Tax=Sphingomonas sp. QA11 TaxID=2950605 RepID=UPI00234A699C|nr:phosphorylase [Sphingomonas sp. QA11]WCM25649.1 phosphorylase [Sphingomonas sp. QA11]